MAALVALISTAAGHASRVGIPALPSVYTAADELSEAPSDPLAPFRLSLGSSISALKKVASVDVQGYLRAKDDVYLHVALPSSTEAASVRPASTRARWIDNNSASAPRMAPEMLR